MSETLTTNSTISHYRITKTIGASRMVEVYSALDTRLNRKVSLKFLPTDLRLYCETGFANSDLDLSRRHGSVGFSRRIEKMFAALLQQAQMSNTPNFPESSHSDGE